MMGCSLKPHLERRTHMVNRKGMSVAVIVGVAFCRRARWRKSLYKKTTRSRATMQKKEIQAVVKMADDLAAGQPVPNDLGLAWGHADFMKAQGNKQYAPFTVTLDPAKTTAGVVAFYWRVVSKDAAPPPPAVVDPKDAKKDDKKSSAEAARVRVRGHQLRAPVTAGQTMPIRLNPGVRRFDGARRRLRRLRDREGADLDAEERAAREGVRHQTDADGAGFLEQRARRPAR